MKYKYVLLIAVFAFGGCSTWKKSLKANGNQNQAIENSIIDFMHSSSLSKKDSVFFIKVNDIPSGIMVVNVIANYNKVLPLSDTKIGYQTNTIPTRYIERNGKLFYWYDSKEILTTDMVGMLSNYKIIDSMNVTQLVGIPKESYVDDSTKGVNYFICKNNLLKYKKITTSTAFGYFEIPKVDCKNY